MLLLFGILTVFVYKDSFINYFFDNSVVGFFAFGSMKVWYVGAILILYLCFPLVFRLVKKNYRWVLLLAGIICLVCFFPLWKELPNSVQIVKEIFLPRVPVFLIGACCGKAIIEGEAAFISLRICVLVFAVTFSLLSINLLFNEYEKWTITRILFIPFSLSTTLLFTVLFDRIARPKRLVLLGSISFELYLIFERTLLLIPRPSFIFSNIPVFVGSLLVNIFSMFISIVLAFGINKLSKKIQRAFIQ